MTTSVKDEASQDETTIDESTEDGDTDFRPFDEISESYSPSVIMKVTATDGLPTQVVVPSENDDIPVLSTETLICMGDFSKFWRTDQNGKRVEYSPDEVRLTDSGNFCLKDDPAMRVYPLRPQCRHYVRQVTQLDLNTKYKAHIRLCAARRTTEGTFMTLRDMAMWACSMREPRDIASEEKYIQSFDNQKIEEGRNRQYNPLFGNPKQQ